MQGLLVVVSCGSQKVWDRFPDAGPRPACEAYTGPPFHAARRYAEHFSERWVIVSAKYGFVDPDFVIPQNYNVTFYSPHAIEASELIMQVAAKGLAQFRDVAVVGSFVYWQRVMATFKDTNAELRHVNRGLGFPPLLIRHLNQLVSAETPWPK